MMNEIDEFGNPISNQQNADRYAPLSIDEFGNPVTPSAPVASEQSTSFAPALSKAEYLASRRAQKEERLKARAGLAVDDMSDTFGELENARESFANKIVNDYTPAELEYLVNRANDEYGLVYTNKGYMRQDAEGNFTPFEGDTSTYGSLYYFKTKDGNNKIGVWGGIDPRQRFNQEYLKNRSGTGEKGVDADQLERNYIMPVAVTGMLEALHHGNKYYLENRVARDYRPNGEEKPLPEYYENRDAYGSGMTEMYRPFDVGTLPQDYDREALWNNFTQRFRPEQRGALTEEEELAYYNELARRRAEGVANNPINRAFNTLAGAGAAITNALVVGTADLVGDATGLYDIGTDEENRKMVNKWFGYDSTNADRAAEEAKKHVTKMYEAYKNDEPIDMEDMYKAIIAGATLELAVTSIAETLVLFFGIGAATRTGKAIQTVEKEYRAAMATATTPAAKEAAKRTAKEAVDQIKSDATLLDSAKFFAAKNAGYINQVAVTTNNTLDEFKANNDGEVSASDIIRIAAVNSLALGVDRFSAAVVLDGVPGVPTATETLKRLLPGGPNVSTKERSKALKDVVAQMTPEEYRKVAASALATISYIGKVGTSAGTEAITEYGQTLAEVFNERYATEKYGSDVAKIIFSDDAQITALTGAAIGAGVGGGITASTGGIGLTVDALRGFRSGDSAITQNSQGGFTESTTEPVSEEQRAADREMYRNTINNLSQALESEDFTPDSLGQMAQVLQGLNSLAYAANNTTSEQQAADKAVIDKVKDLVVGMVVDSEDGSVVLSRTVVVSEDSNGQEGAPVDESLETETDSTQPAPLPESSTEDFSVSEQRALVELVLSEAARKYKGEIPADVEVKLHNFATTNNVNKKSAERILKSYASVEIEATIEDRGVVTRTERLEQTLTSGTATKEDVQKQYDEAKSFYATTRASIDALEQGIAEAETKAKTLNKKAWSGSKKPETIKTKYMTDKESDSKGEPFTIVVSFGADKKWHAHVGEARKRIESKKRTARSLYALLETFHTQAEALLDPDTILSTGGYVITQSSGKPSKGVADEQKYVANVKEALNGKPINKVIVTEGRAKHWEPTGMRARINSAVTNTYTTRDTLYTADDVVYLHAPGTVRTGKYTYSELFKKSSESVRELEAAIAAGATIVLAQDHRIGAGRPKKGEAFKEPQGNKVAKVLKSKGYIPYGTSLVERNIFVPDTESNQQRLAERKAENAVAIEARKEEKRLKKRFQTLAVEKTAAPLLEDARPMEEIEADLAEARAAITPYFEKTALDQAIKAAKESQAALNSEETVDVTTEDTVVSETADLTEDETSFDDDIDMDVVNLIASENVEENLNTYESTVIRDAIDKAKEEVKKAERSGQIVEFPPSAKSIEALYKEAVRQENLAGEKGKAVLDAWKAAKEKRLEGSSLREAINEGLEALGFKVVARKDKAEGNLEFGGIGKEILNNSLGSTIDTVTYNIKLKRFDNARQVVYDHMTKFTPNAVKVGQKIKYKGKDHTVVSINKVIHNPSSYLKSTKGTALNTIPVDMLPQVFKDMTEATKKAFKKSIVALTADEKDFSKPTGLEDRPGQYNTFDSPARNLIFDKDGNVHESMFLAMAMSIGSVLNNDKSKLLLGPKNKKVVAAMFGIQEDNVTQAHMDFARKHGAYGLSVKDTLGKGVLQALGISLDRTSSVGIHHYNRLVADLGNMVLRVAEEQGFLQTTEVSSNALSSLIKGGEERKGEAADQETTFVSIPHKSVKTEAGIKKNEPNATSGQAIAAFEEADEMMPNVTSMIKEPFFGKAPDPGYQARAVANIRNDLVESAIPAAAKKMLKSSMNTKYEMNEKEVDRFFAMMETAEGELKAKRLFGFIPIDPKDPQYAGLLYDQKIIQEYINDDIERSIEHLRKLRDQIKDGTVKNSMYFGFFYSGNQRYSIDSNTINPQNDKIHRFFIQPAAHRVTYKVDRTNNSFIYEYVQNGEKKTIDSSLYVRAALAQAFGVKIDKTRTKRIIDLGNALLSLTQKQVEELRQLYLDTGEMVLMINGEKEIFEPDHPTHTFQALDFIHSYAGSTKDTFENSLTAEFDALTSGFANKVQQLATLKDLTAHSNRVAVLRKVLNNPDIVSIEESKTSGINDLLADKERVDSYENLAKIVLKQLGSLIRDLSPDRQELFATLQTLLPGGTLIGQADAAVDSALRSLFKPSFMIFNYSASVNRIVKNLGTEMITGVLEQISKADFSQKNKPEVQAAMKAADALAKRLPPGEEGPMSAAGFQELIRTESLSRLFVPVTEITVGNDGKNEPRNLVDYLSAALIKDTYGKAVDTAFKTEFEDFIKIQDATNDMFKQAFAVFNKHLLNKIEKFREDPNNTVITEDTMKGFIMDLRGVFPVIAGPLTAIIDNQANLAEGVHVYDTTVKSPNEIMSTGASPQSKFKDSKGEHYSRKSNPLVKSMIAAANAGAVLPFHAIDGAELATMVNDFVAGYVRGNETLLGVEQQHENDPDTVGSGILPLHDAKMGPLPYADIQGFLYNKGTYDINSKYSMMEEIYKMVERTLKAVTDPGNPLYLNPKTLKAPESLSIWKDKDVKEEKKRATKLIEEKKAALEKAKADKAPQHEIDSIEHSIRVHGESISFLGIFTRSFNAFEQLRNQVAEAREKVYTTGTKIGTMAGFRGSIYTVKDPNDKSPDEPSLEYLKEFHDDGSYKKTTPTVVKPAPEDASKPASEAAEQEGTGFKFPGTATQEEGNSQTSETEPSSETEGTVEETVPEGDFSGNIDAMNQAGAKADYKKSADIVEDILKGCEG